MVFIFFRDANLTDVMFRLDEQFRWALDLAALDREDELNAVVAKRLGPAAPRPERRRRRDRRHEQARKRVEPALTNWPVTVLFSSRRRQAEFLPQMNERLGLDHLRKMEAADIAGADEERSRLRARRRRVRAAVDAARRRAAPA